MEKCCEMGHGDTLPPVSLGCVESCWCGCWGAGSPAGKFLFSRVAWSPTIVDIARGWLHRYWVCPFDLLQLTLEDIRCVCVTFTKVDTGQHDHFKHLLRTLVHLGHDWAADWTLDEFHIKFGRIEGMSTRHGNVVFLREILDELRLRVLDRMNATNS